jgi:uncharacterized protein HemX
MQNSTYTSKKLLVAFMLLMVVGLGSSIYFFGRLQTAKENLKAANADLVKANESVKLLNDSILRVKEELVKVQKEMVRLVNGSVKSGIRDSSTYVALGNAVDSTWNLLNPTKFDKAIRLERAAFEAIRDGRFQAAIDLLKQTEEVYPNFHQAHEIRLFLESKSAGSHSHGSATFQPAETRAIQKAIVKQFAWKAPADLVQQIVEKTK